MDARSRGLTDQAIYLLMAAHLVRAEFYESSAWYELAHDRLIGPIRADNAAWFEANLSPLQRAAAKWETQGRPDGLLFRAEELEKAKRWAESNPELIYAVDRVFLHASRELQASREVAKKGLVVGDHQNQLNAVTRLAESGRTYAVDLLLEALNEKASRRDLLISSKAQRKRADQRKRAEMRAAIVAALARSVTSRPNLL